MDEAMSFLLPTLILLVAGTAVLLATRIWKERRRLGSRAGSSPLAEETPPHGPAAPQSPLYIPCGCGPACTPCVTAARELQDLVTPLWPGVSFPQDSEMWRLSWQDLEQLLERGHLPCCASSSSSRSLHPSRSLSERIQASRSRHPTRLPIGWKTSPTGKCSVLRRTRRWLRSSTLPRMSSPRKGSSVATQALCDPCCAPTGTWPVPAKKQVEVSWSRRCLIHGSQDPVAEPSGQTLRTLLDKRLQRQRQLPPCPGRSLDLAVEDEAKEDLHTGDINSQGVHPCQSLHEISWTPDGGAHTDRSPCCLGAVAFHRTHQIPIARKSLETQRGAQGTPAKHSQQQEVSLSRRCPVHGSQDTAAVPQENTLRAALDKRLQRDREHPFFKGALGRWLSRLRMQLLGSSWHTP